MNITEIDAAIGRLEDNYAGSEVTMDTAGVCKELASKLDCDEDLALRLVQATGDALLLETVLGTLTPEDALAASMLFGFLFAEQVRAA